MKRADFLKSGSLLGAASLLSTTNAFAQNLTNNDIDKLVDANGNYIQQALPYNENFLEPYMDAETMHLHYTFHHSGAVKGANKDLSMIKKHWMKTIWKLLTFGQRNYLITFLPMFCTLSFGQTSLTKRLYQQATC